MCYWLFDYFFTYKLKWLNKVSVFKIICLKALSCFLEELDFIILVLRHGHRFGYWGTGFHHIVTQIFTFTSLLMAYIAVK